jgi:outer membrane protein TolC
MTSLSFSRQRPSPAPFAQPALLFALALVALTPARAQSPAPPATTTTPTDTATDAPAEVIDPAAAPPPFRADVDDPLLQPVAAPKRTLQTWDEARDLLEARSTDLGLAVANLDVAEGRWRQSLAALLPNGRLQGGVGYDLINPRIPALGVTGAGAAGIAVAVGGITPTIPVAAGALTINQPLVDVGAWSGLYAASKGEDAARLSTKDARRRLTQGLATTLVAVVAAERAAELNRLGLRQALERNALTDRQNKLGVATVLDVVRIQQDVELARQSLIAGDEQLRRTRESLGQTLGEDGEVGVAASFDLGGLGDELVERCEVLQDGALRDDIVAARARLEAAEASRDQALWGYLPRLDLSTSAAALTTDPGPGRLATWSIGATVSIPIWEGGLREGLLRERDGVVRQAEQQQEAVRRSLVVEVSRTTRNERTAFSLFQSAKQSRDLADKADQLTRRAFELGRTGSLEVVQTAQALRQAELNLAWREYEWAQARLDALLTLARCDA